ncbi:DUF6602 domain-containing protein [Niastella sp. OAS944]|uniref:DUF6602 domain-containing protein n=1 Tax=Niastella sp. OAS944 TaxID=2664089 RepID=UPI00348FA896|nr:hypothetical protein [Chitinophagaceae bacterium OAS944]
MEPFEQYHNYSQNLLLAQYEVSEIIRHNLTRGEVREDFIIQYLTKTITNCQSYLKRGFINLGQDQQSGQADILLIKRHAETIDLGNRGNVIVNPEDCLMVMEVKSTLTGPYLNDFNTEAQLIKNANSNIVCGMFAYKAELEKQTIMLRCGHDYNVETDTYFDSDKDPLPTWYPYIDFVLLVDKLESNGIEENLELQGANQIFVRKALGVKERYFIGTFNPAVRNLISLVRSLLIQ